MISLSVTLFQFRTKISANLCRTLTEGSVMQIPQYRLSILGDKHQMYVQNVGRMALFINFSELHSVTQSGLIDMAIMLHTER